jgi:hypothetical protein
MLYCHGRGAKATVGYGGVIVGGGDDYGNSGGNSGSSVQVKSNIGWE